MSICYDGYGSFLIKKDKQSEVKEKIEKLFKEYDEKQYMFNENGLFQFENYARHHFMSSLLDILEKNVSDIDSGYAWFSCTDEDSRDDKGFPFKIYAEVCDGKYTEQVLNRRLDCEWPYHYVDNEWFEQLRVEKEKEDKKTFRKFKRRQILYKFKQFFYNFKKKDAKKVNSNVDDDLPF